MAVVTIFIPASKTFAEIILIVAQVNVVPVISIGRILIGVSIFRVKSPSVLPVSLTRAVALVVTVVNGPLQHLSAILAGLVIAATAIVTIVGGTKIIVAPVFETQLVQSQLLEISLLIE